MEEQAQVPAHGPSGFVIGAGLTLAASMFVPLTPGGTSFLGVVAELLSRNWAEGALFVLSFGGPYLFAVGLCIAASIKRGPLPRWLLQSAVSLFQAQLVLWALRATLAGFGIMPGALLGFSLVGAVYMIYFSAKVRAEGAGHTGPSVQWLARWGAVLVIALGAWLRLQMAVGLRMGPAVEVGIFAALLIVFATRRR